MIRRMQSIQYRFLFYKIPFNHFVPKQDTGGEQINNNFKCEFRGHAKFFVERKRCSDAPLVTEEQGQRKSKSKRNRSCRRSAEEQRAEGPSVPRSPIASDDRGPASGNCPKVRRRSDPLPLKPRARSRRTLSDLSREGKAAGATWTSAPPSGPLALQLTEVLTAGGSESRGPEASSGGGPPKCRLLFVLRKGPKKQPPRGPKLTARIKALRSQLKVTAQGH